MSGRPVAHVAAKLGISRATGYKWWRRWQREGVAGAAALAASAAALLAGALPLAVTRHPVLALSVFLDLLLAAGLLRLMGEPSWRSLASAAAVVALRRLIGQGIRLGRRSWTPTAGARTATSRWSDVVRRLVRPAWRVKPPVDGQDHASLESPALPGTRHLCMGALGQRRDVVSGDGAPPGVVRLVCAWIEGWCGGGHAAVSTGPRRFRLREGEEWHERVDGAARRGRLG